MLKIETKLDQRGRILIPKELRKELKIKSGGKVTIEKTMNAIVVRPKVKHPVKALASLHADLGKEPSHEIIRKLREEVDSELEEKFK